MSTLDISWLSLGVGALLLLIPLIALHVLRTGLVRSLAIASLRMVVQLFLIGVYLKYLFVWDLPWLNTLWVLAMTVIATHTLGARTNLPQRLLALPAFVGMFVTGVVVGLFFLVPILHLSNPFTARYFIPILGILLGNMLGVNVITLSTFYSNLSNQQSTYYYLLGNGATRFEALLPFLRDAVIKSFSPCIANMAVMGIVALPGTMIGQILGGSQPDVAIKYQMMIVIITTSASMLSVIITLWLTIQKSFDSYGRLRQSQLKK
ncbi:MAG: ABC transporter permease [Bacteroidaceae bacterium]|nr:ABC transporter permease [Bacteroidaceae bacterium]